MESRDGRLEADVDHIKSGMGQMKQDIRRLDAMANQGMIAVTELRGEMLEGFATLRGEMKAGRWADRISWLMISAGILASMARGFKWI